MTKQEEIKYLKNKKDAVILAHYYALPEIQEIADYIGDSFYLSKIAQGLPNHTLVFCGVEFMGESAKLLCPDKEVLMPDATADCPMAHMVTKEQVDAFREKYDDLAVVCYINSTAAIKSWSDVCVTSANAVKIVKNLPNKNILFIPDKNLGRYVQEQIPEKNVMLIDGYCPIHENMIADEIKELKSIHPKAEILVHPECSKEICDMADYIGSTTGIINTATESDKKEFIIGTEIGVLHKLKELNPDKTFYFTKTTPICQNMKKNTLDKIIHVLKTSENQATVPAYVAKPAANTLTRMLELSK